jgi:circadian clock protein KaiC
MFLADGVINLESDETQKNLKVVKYRGSDFKNGSHSYKITDQGMAVFPKLLPAQHKKEYELETLPFGIPEMNELLHGGIERGTITFFAGPTGIGKTTLGMQFIKEMAGRGERSVHYLFEEDKRTLLERCRSIMMPVDKMLNQGTLHLEEVEPMQYSANEFAKEVRREVEENDTKIIVLDSVSGYELMMKDEEVTRAIYSLCRYLKNQGVTVVLINEISNITGDFTVTEHGTSFIGDNIIFMRYLELEGKMEKVIGVLKKRSSGFENSLRKFKITSAGIKVGEPMNDFQGILRGVARQNPHPKSDA